MLKSQYSKIIISNITYKKITSPSCPKFIKNSLNKLIEESYIKVEEIHIPSKTFDDYCYIMDYFNDKIVSKAEAASLALAIKHNGLIGCNDLVLFKDIIEKYDLDYVTSADILFNAYKMKILSEEETSILWNKMYHDRVALPKKSFLEYLEDK